MLACEKEREREAFPNFLVQEMKEVPAFGSQENF